MDVPILWIDLTKDLLMSEPLVNGLAPVQNDFVSATGEGLFADEQGVEACFRQAEGADLFCLTGRILVVESYKRAAIGVKEAQE
jgi:hypothetical protein